jgi:hypothetical protein
MFSRQAGRGQSAGNPDFGCLTMQNLLSSGKKKSGDSIKDTAAGRGI